MKHWLESIRNWTLLGALCLASLALSFASCSPAASPSDGGEKTSDAAPDKVAEKTPDSLKPIPKDADLEMKAEDFDCILNWTKVGRYRITNKLGYLEHSLRVARSKTGGEFPVGTVIQLIPQEAMVKRKKGWNPKTNDWEFFYLKIDGKKTIIVSRGKEEVKNQFGGNCYACHSKAGQQWDLICTDSHGCDPLPFTPEVIEGVQRDDSRCKK